MIPAGYRRDSVGCIRMGAITWILAAAFIALLARGSAICPTNEPAQTSCHKEAWWIAGKIFASLAIFPFFIALGTTFLKKARRG